MGKGSWKHETSDARGASGAGADGSHVWRGLSTPTSAASALSTRERALTCSTEFASEVRVLVHWLERAFPTRSVAGY